MIQQKTEYGSMKNCCGLKFNKFLRIRLSTERYLKSVMLSERLSSYYICTFL